MSLKWRFMLFEVNNAKKRKVYGAHLEQIA
jgi:hypothetical protein